MIKQIIEKYNTERSFTTAGGMTIHYTGIVPDKFPALEHELEQEMEKRAVAFATYVHMADKPAIVHDLYDRFKFEQWAEREGYVKDGTGWMNTPMIQCTDADLYTQFKQEAK